jgi:nitrate reductase gamma subunit
MLPVIFKSVTERNIVVLSNTFSYDAIHVLCDLYRGFFLSKSWAAWPPLQHCGISHRFHNLVAVYTLTNRNVKCLLGLYYFLLANCVNLTFFFVTGADN